MSRTLLPSSKQTSLHRPSKSVSQLPSIQPSTSRLLPRGSALRPPSTIIQPNRTNSTSPTSSASSSAPTVIHNAPAPPPQPLHPSVTSLLLTNLRLLDLDQRNDWPSPSVKTFSATANQKERIKVVEWILYQLFALWDPAETTYKLQPFFPPLEPLQSLNLRAALFRCLDVLKKNGVLGREVILRKTMLDECKGDKLIEVLLSFSTAILKRIQAQQMKKSGRPATISMQMTLGSGGPAPRASMLPLAIVHKAKLARLIEAKDEKRARFAAFADMISSKDAELKDRQQVCDSAIHLPISASQEEKVLHSVQANWTGTSSWPHAILQGDAESLHDAPFQRSFTEIWDVMVNGGELKPREENAPGLITQLEERIGMQRNRLAEWKVWKDRMSKLTQNDRPTASGALQETGAYTDQPFIFVQHQELHLNRPTFDQSPRSPPGDKSPGRYQSIIAEMTIRLTEAKKSKHAANPTTNFLDLAMDRKVPSSKGQQRANAVDSFRPSMHPRVPSDPLQPPRQFTLKRSFSPASIFSPLRNVPAVKDEDDAADVSLSDVLGLDKLRINDDTSPATCPVATSSSTLEASTRNRLFPDTPVDSSDLDSSVTATSPQLPGQIISKLPEHLEVENVPSSTPLSLAERTRLSMASFSRPSTKRTKSTLSIEDNNITTAQLSSTVPDSESSDPTQETLAERTRQSLAFMMQPQSQDTITNPVNNEVARSRISMGGNELIGTRLRRAPRDSILQPKKTRPSLSYPVNQFETPRKPSPLSGFSEEDEENYGDVRASNEGFAREIRRIATPTEKLFAVDADPASVFRSRPKIMASPVLSPYNPVMDDFGGYAGMGSPLERR